MLTMPCMQSGTGVSFVCAAWAASQYHADSSIAVRAHCSSLDNQSKLLSQLPAQLHLMTDAICMLAASTELTGCYQQCRHEQQQKCIEKQKQLTIAPYGPRILVA